MVNFTRPHDKFLPIFANPRRLILLPAFLWLTVFLVIPASILLVFSLGHRDDLGRFVLGFSMQNYLRFVNGPYLDSLWRSFCLATLTTIVCLGLGFPAAAWLAFSVPKQKQNLYMTLIVAPLASAFLLRIYAWITILRPTGLLSFCLHGLGVHQPVIILYTPAAIAIGMVYNYLPYMILPLYSALAKLDWRLLEAAADLGASPWRSFWKVTVPLSSRGIVAGIIIVFVPSLGDYVTPDLLGGAKTMFIGNLIQNQFLAVRDWAFGSAVSTILILIVAVFIWVYLKHATPGVAH